MDRLTLAQDLREALRYLDVSPLHFNASEGKDGDLLDQRRYVERPGEGLQGRRARRKVMDQVKDRLLLGGDDTKLFLSGHIGAGKSTELARLVADPEVAGRFQPVAFRFEEEEWSYLDSTQILFRLVVELYRFGHHNKLLKQEGRWHKLLLEMDTALGGQQGIVAKEGAVSVEWNLIFVKLRQELKLSDGRRKQFREFGETQQTLLQDTVVALLQELEQGLRAQGSHLDLLLVMDDLDKVRSPDSISDIFDRNVNALLQPPVRMLATLPRAVMNTAAWPRFSHDCFHLRPVQVLQRIRADKPEEAFNRDALPFFHDALCKRLRPGLVEEPALEQAVLYSGGVLREFFHLLRDAALLAYRDGLSEIPGDVMEEVVQDTRRRAAYGLFPADRQALAAIHGTHDLLDASQTAFLDRSWVLECHNGDLWYEVAPLLWALLS